MVQQEKAPYFCNFIYSCVKLHLVEYSRAIQHNKYRSRRKCAKQKCNFLEVWYSTLDLEVLPQFPTLIEQIISSSLYIWVIFISESSWYTTLLSEIFMWKLWKLVPQTDTLFLNLGMHFEIFVWSFTFWKYLKALHFVFSPYEKMKCILKCIAFRMKINFTKSYLGRLSNNP